MAKRVSRKPKAKPDDHGLEWIAEPLRGLAVPVEDLVQDPSNARKHGDRNMEAIRASLQVYGQRKPLVVRRSGMVVEAGNGTLAAALALGWSHVAAVLVDDDAMTATGFALADNRSGELAEWDDEVLASLVKELDAELLAPLWNEFEIETLLGDGFEPGAGGAGEDPGAGEPPAKPVSKRGEVYALGPHRLMCGDSTSTEDVSALLGGERADMFYGDPPYGMALDPRYDRMHSSPDRRTTGDRFSPVEGDDEPFDPRPVLNLWPAPESFWWGADYYRGLIPDGGSWVVWDKRSNDSGMDLDSVIGSCFELCWSQEKHKREIARVLWSGHHGMQGTDTKRRVHPTQKPVALAEWFFSRWSSPGDLIVDPFLGSGTTLIAAAETGRRCYGMEISPAYCDVIRKRWGAYAKSAGVDPGSDAL